MDLESQVTAIEDVTSTPSIDPEALRAIELYDKGWSYSQIGAELKWNRNQVAGKISRTLKKLGREPERRQMRVVPKAENVTPHAPRVIPMRKRVEPTKERVRVRLIESEREVTLMELQAHMCKWPIGDPRMPDFRFCGCPRVSNKPYCETHVQMGVQLPYQRRA